MKIKHIKTIEEAFRILPIKEKLKIKKLIQEAGHTSEEDIEYMSSTFVECGIARRYTFDSEVFKQFVEHWKLKK